MRCLGQARRVGEPETSDEMLEGRAWCGLPKCPLPAAGCACVVPEDRVPSAPGRWWTSACRTTSKDCGQGGGWTPACRASSGECGQSERWTRVARCPVSTPMWKWTPVCRTLSGERRPGGRWTAARRTVSGEPQKCLCDGWRGPWTPWATGLPLRGPGRRGLELVPQCLAVSCCRPWCGGRCHARRCPL